MNILYRRSYPIKILFICFLFILVFSSISGCSIERKVQNNQFYSSYPKMNINIDDKFSFLGDGKYYTSSTYADMEYQFFYFISKDSKNQFISKGIIIEVGTPTIKSSGGVTFYTRINDQSKFVMKHDQKLIKNKSLEFFTCSTSLPIASHITKFSRGKGYVQPQCALSQVILVSGVDTFRKIIYFEDVSLSGWSCFQWADKNKLNEEQKKYLEDFTNRADQSMIFSDF